MRRITTATLITVAALATASTAAAHCQIPCGIYDDELRVQLIEEHITTVEKSMKQVAELGELETPIVLTNTLCVGTAVQAVVDWTLRQLGNEEVQSVNVVVGETNDGYLNDIRRCAVRNVDVEAAIEEGVDFEPATSQRRGLFALQSSWDAPTTLERIGMERMSAAPVQQDTDGLVAKTQNPRWMLHPFVGFVRNPEATDHRLNQRRIR